MNVYILVIIGLLIPFLGTTLGSSFVFFLKGELKPAVQKTLLGFAAGVMVAASVWSLIIPSLEASASMGKFSWFPSAFGVALGMFFLLALDHLIPHLHINADRPEGVHKNIKVSRTMMLFLAVTLHNIPEGMAPGVTFTAFLNGMSGISFTDALALCVGMAIQNIPEGAVISLPLASSGEGKTKAFIKGVLSGAVEPVGALLTIFLTALVAPLLPYLLSLAAGAMLYVVVEELIPEATGGEHSDHGPVGFGIGFILMMILDVVL